MTRGKWIRNLLVALFMTACAFYCLRRICLVDPIRKSFRDSTAFHGLWLLTDLGTWTKNLGAPEVIDQVDGVHTFFYWPRKGVAVFTHPHYHAQYRSVPQKNWKVTSILVPIKHEVVPIVRTHSGKSIKFDKLVSLECDGYVVSPLSYPDIQRSYRFCSKRMPGVIDITNSLVPLYPKERSRVYVTDGELTQIEFRIIDPFASYD